MKKVIQQVDKEVGGRLRQRRNELGITQAALAELIGIKFQQVQKYEKGINRISAGRLQLIAETLHVPPTFFFDGLRTTAETWSANEVTALSDFLGKAEGQALSSAYSRIRSKWVRDSLRRLIGAIADAEEERQL